MKEHSVLWYTAPFIFLLFHTPLVYPLEELTDAVGSPVMKDMLISTDGITNQDRDKGVTVV